jgi:hypothetical protein
MDLDELENLIHQCETEIKTAEKGKYQLMNSKEGKFATKAMMKKNLQPLNEALKA